MFKIWIQGSRSCRKRERTIVALCGDLVETDLENSDRQKPTKLR